MKQDQYVVQYTKRYKAKSDIEKYLFCIPFMFTEALSSDPRTDSENSHKKKTNDKKENGVLEKHEKKSWSEYFTFYN